ncbi:MAG: hypothetical protein COV52_06525 [Gammaproteobacteria bacterium CG11_big_fil_rev_8_21_14_0_20_46_22]|nr:MAG: hypothetical protein COW05_00570 [Gammaproteobacteria bacterium CG12_big_fil_rev_8_21_14_0_65_46_12]PIR10893.1 MAG: hypothetical protein COV52_06525 [Gammaproteobacteria bacterium CG11_big_fil_rev_8_21_14_0_20_46_22]
MTPLAIAQSVIKDFEQKGIRSAHTPLLIYLCTELHGFETAQLSDEVDSRFRQRKNSGKGFAPDYVSGVFGDKTVQNLGDVTSLEKSFGQKINRLLKDIKRKFGFLKPTGPDTLELYRSYPCCLFFSRQHPFKRLTTAERVMEIAKLTLVNRLGSCEMQACLAFQQLNNDQRINTSLELIQFKHADHVVLLIGRTQGDLNDPKSWNDDAAICDPSTHNCYEVHQLEKQMLFLDSIKVIRYPNNLSCYSILSNQQENGCEAKVQMLV